MPDLNPCDALKQADQAYLDVMTNGAVRAVTDQNGEHIEFSTANAAALLNYIRTLAPMCPAYRPLALGLHGSFRPLRGIF